MADKFFSNHAGHESATARESVGEATRANRKSYIVDNKGNAVGNNYTVPHADFSHFLGYKPPTPAEIAGHTEKNGARVIELALQKEMSNLGQGAADRGNEYRNIFISSGRYENSPGTERAMLRDARDAIAAGPDKNSLEDMVARLGPKVGPYFHELNQYQAKSHDDNVRYLEMQYKFMEMSKQDDTISNLMKTRNDAVSRVIRGSGTNS